MVLGGILLLYVHFLENSVTTLSIKSIVLNVIVIICYLLGIYLHFLIDTCCNVIAFFMGKINLI